MPWNQTMFRMAKKIEKDWNWTINHFFSLSQRFFMKSSVEVIEWVSALIDCKTSLASFSSFFKYFLVCPIWLPLFSFFSIINEPALGAVIYPSMALKPFPLSIGWDSNPRSSNLELSMLTTRPDFRSFLQFF